MSYSANQYNHATPLSSSTQLVSGTLPEDAKYFTLHDNALDGTCYVVPDEVGLWGDTLSSEDGTLPATYILTVEENARINSILVAGSKYSYPVDFVVTLYNGSTVLNTFNIEGNTEVQHIIVFPEYFDVTKYTISVTKISSSNNVARLYSVSYPVHVGSSDTLHVYTTEASTVSGYAKKTSHDALQVAMYSADNIIKYKRSSDVLNVSIKDSGYLHNIHSVMKSSFRQIFGKVQVTYADPMLDYETNVVAEEAYNSNKSQVLEGTSTKPTKYFNLYSNDLSGNYALIGENSTIGWVSPDISDENGYFEEPQHIRINMFSRPIVSMEITFDSRYDSIVEDFNISLEDSKHNIYSYQYTGNTNNTFTFNEEAVTDIVSVDIAITKVSRPYSPAVILSIPLLSTVLYKGYEDFSEIMSIDLLEELTYQDEIEALGGISANEVTVAIDNSGKNFLFANAKNKAFSDQFKRNRKVEPFLGAEIMPGLIEWYPLGTFWSYKWDAPLKSFATTVVAFDTIGLLNTTSYFNHVVQRNKSIGQLIEYVLNDAKQQLNFIEYVIDSSLYNVIIPYAWFDHSSHAAALRKISECYPMHIYCDRQGRICAAPQKLRLDYAYDTWSDSTNVIDKKYSSLYTALPNIAIVHVRIPVEEETQLVSDNQQFVVTSTTTRTLTFSKPYISNISISVDCDSSVSYTYNVYSWGAEFVFTGTGTVRSISCTGIGLDVSNESVISRQDEYSIKIDGAITRDIKSDFIQTTSLATYIVDRLFSLSENDKYDVEVQYRGDIALTINDPIILEDGIVQDNRYNIKRHQLSWNGSLTGTANLNA